LEDAVAGGPVEYLIVGVPNTQFSENIVVPEIMKLVESGTIRILDMVIVSRRADGSLVERRYDHFHQALGIGTPGCVSGGMISMDDVEQVSESLEVEHSVALFLWEDLWAAPLAESILKINGVVVGSDRVDSGMVGQPLARPVTA
jgi:hypothetical protein